jgi:hypothetical protein
MVELSSLYMGRAMVGSMAGTPFGPALAALTTKIQKALPPRLREFLDRPPALVVHLEPAPAALTNLNPSTSSSSPSASLNGASSLA